MQGTARDRREGATDASEYERLRTARRERRGNVERATVREAFVGDEEVVLTLAFDWTTDDARVVYDLDDDRDLLELTALAESRGFDFEHIGLLEGETVEAVYTGSEWVPDVRPGDAGRGSGSRAASATDRSRSPLPESAESSVLARASGFVRGLTTKQLIIAVVLVKKLVVVALLVWLVL